MLLSIDQTKLDEVIANSKLSYTVSPCNLEMPGSGPDAIEAPTAQIAGTEDFITPEFERYRNRVLSLRRGIIEREGTALSSDDLERVLDGYRGRA